MSRKVTAAHKANITELSDGLFLESCRTIAAAYEGRVEFEDRIVDNMCMQLVRKPELFEVLVLLRPRRNARDGGLRGRDHRPPRRGLGDPMTSATR